MNITTKNQIRKQFAAALRNTRIAAGITQEELAFHLEVDHTIISRYECAKSNPTLIRLYELAEVLNCPVIDLILPKKTESE